MAAEYAEITERNQPDADSMLAHIMTDLHDALAELHRQGRLLDKHDAVLTEFRPVIDRFRSPLASRLPGGRKRT